MSDKLSWKLEALSNFEEVISKCKFRNVKRKYYVRILIDGDYFVTPKGKTVWSSVAAAKNALRLHIIENIIWNTNEGKLYPISDYIKHEELKPFVEELYQSLLDNRVTIEYILIHYEGWNACFKFLNFLGLKFFSRLV